MKDGGAVFVYSNEQNVNPDHINPSPVSGDMHPNTEPMDVVPGHLIDGTTYTDYLIDQGIGQGFAARLQGTALTVDWHGGQGSLMSRLARVQQNAGGPGSITIITGYATDNLGSLVASGRFDPVRFSNGLRKHLGGTWNTQVTQQGIKHVITGIRTANQIK